MEEETVCFDQTAAEGSCAGPIEYHVAELGNHPCSRCQVQQRKIKEQEQKLKQMKTLVEALVKCLAENHNECAGVENVCNPHRKRSNS